MLVIPTRFTSASGDYFQGVLIHFSTSGWILCGTLGQ